MVSEAMNIDADGLFPLEMPALMPVSGMPDTEGSGAFPHPFIIFSDEDDDEGGFEDEDGFGDDGDFEDEGDFDDDDEDDDFEDEEDDDYDYGEDSDYDYDDD